MLSEVPRHVLVDCVLVPYLSGRDICSLVFTSKSWWDALGQEENMWKQLYSQQSQLLAYTRLPPRFPTCGNWRDVYLRSARRRKLIIVRSLTRPEEDLRLVLPRITPLFGLKREIRSAQLRLDGLYLEDFDLFDRVDGIQVGIAGNDSLPPTEDIKRLLFLGMRSEAMGAVGGGAAAAAQRRRDAGWRANLSILPDGIVLEQVLSKGQGKPELDFSACQHSPYQTSLLLDEANSRGGGPTSFKTAWRSFTLHPLLQNASPTSLGLFCQQYLKSVARPRFALDVFVLKALLTSGFALSFYRLCSILLPMVWTTQIKQMFRITHVLFLPVFVRDLTRVLAKAILPVMGASLRTELLRLLIRLVFTWETEYESVIVNGGEMVRELLATRHKWDVEGLLRHASTSPALAYSLSSTTYWLFTKVTEPSLWVSLPLYLYSLPIVYCVIALRIRVFLAQSYVSLLLA